MTPLALLMHREIEQVPQMATLLDVARRMRDRKVGALLVSDGTRPIGIVSEADLVRKAMADGYDPATTPVEAVMSHPLISIDIDKTAWEASDLMAARSVRHLIVTDGDEGHNIVGILSVRDLVVCFKNRL